MAGSDIAAVSQESRSFQRLCVLLAIAISLIFSVRYGLMIFQGVTNAIFAHDFEVFYRAAVSFALDGHHSPYGLAQTPQEIADNPHYHPFLNPPFLLYLLWPLGRMSYASALGMYIFMQVLLWIAVLHSRPVRALWPGLSRQKGYLLTCIAISLPFMTNTILTGQLGIFYAAILLYGISILKLRPYLGGAVLALMACKPTLAMLIPVYMLASRNWRAMASFGVVALMLCFSACLTWDLAIWADWQQAINLHVQMMGLPHIPEKFQIQLVSFYAGLRMMGLEASPALVLQALLTLKIASVLFWMTYKNPQDARILPFIYVGSFLVTGYTLQYDTVIISGALLYFMDINTRRALLPVTRIGLLLGICSSLVALQFQMMHFPFGALVLIWLSGCIWIQKPQ